MNYFSREHIEKVYILKADAIASLEATYWARTTQSSRVKELKDKLLDYLCKAHYHADSETKLFVDNLESEVRGWIAQDILQ